MLAETDLDVIGYVKQVQDSVQIALEAVSGREVAWSKWPEIRNFTKIFQIDKRRATYEAADGKSSVIAWTALVFPLSQGLSRRSRVYSPIGKRAPQRTDQSSIMPPVCIFRVHTSADRTGMRGWSRKGS